MEWFQLVGPQRTVEIGGFKLVGVNAENGAKFLITLALIALVLIVGRLFRRAADALLRGRKDSPAAFWTRQGVRLFTAALLFIGLVSIWFDDPGRLATAAGLFSAGLAIALQRVVTAVAGYFVILRGKTFNVGDRIVMGGVRGDVIDLSFMQTRIMEMGQPPDVTEQTEPAMWVHSRQFTGRIVTVTNDKGVAEPAYHYPRDSAYIGEEFPLPIQFHNDYAEAETILVEA